VKIGCALGMLQCLDRRHRLAYVLGEILGLSSPDCAGYPRNCFASACSTPVGPSKRLLGSTVVSARTTAPAPALAAYPRRLASGASVPARDFAEQPSSYQETRALIRRAEEARWALQVQRTSHPRASTVDFARRLAQSLDSPREPSSS
jgi:hypothetical protein